MGVAGSVKTGNLAENNPMGHVYFSHKQYVPRTVHLALCAGYCPGRETCAEGPPASGLGSLWSA